MVQVSIGCAIIPIGKQGFSNTIISKAHITINKNRTKEMFIYSCIASDIW